MDPLRLHFLLTVALNAAGLPCAQAAALRAQAERQLRERWPLTGCVVASATLDIPQIITVGRQ